MKHKYPNQYFTELNSLAVMISQTDCGVRSHSSIVKRSSVYYIYKEEEQTGFRQDCSSFVF